MAFVVAFAGACAENKEPRSPDPGSHEADASALRWAPVDVGTVIARGKMLAASEFGVSVVAEIAEVSSLTANAKVVIRNDDPLDVMVYSHYGTPLCWVAEEGADGKWTCFHVESACGPCGTGLGFRRLRTGGTAEVSFGVPHHSGRIRVGVEIDPRAFMYPDSNADDVEVAFGPHYGEGSTFGIVWGPPVKTIAR